MRVSFVLLSLVTALTLAPNAISQQQSEKRPPSKVAVSGKVTNHPDLEKQLKCLAINIYKEAGYESVEGKIAVGQVTMNRVKHREFPNSVCGVVYEKTINRFTGKRTTCQFSWYCDPVHRNRTVNPTKYQESYKIAEKILIKGVRLPELENAIFYHATYIDPKWPYVRITRIGQHIFYEPRNRVILAQQ
jgi:spore germination cell wall hydrolase CwlJ-like protein